MFGKTVGEAGMLERWGRLLTRAPEKVTAEQLSEEFVSVDELSPWTTDQVAEPINVKPQSTKKAPLRAEGPIVKYGSEIRSALGPGTLIEGKFAFDSPVRIDGTLRGEVHSSSLLVVGEEGVIEGLVCVGNLVVYGRLKGHIVADEVIQIGASGEVTADVESGQLAIDLGGRFSGTVK